MKNIILFILLGILTTIGLAGCGADRGNRGKDLQGLSQIEVYSSDGHLINTILDEEILSQFNDLNYTDIPSDTDEEMDTLESKIEDLNVICTNRRTRAIIRHMRRSAFSAGRPGGLIRKITWKAGK